MRTVGHYVFNRHEIFTGKDLHVVSDAIAETKGVGGSDLDLENKLFGLFDGYLHHDLLKLSEVKLSSGVCHDLKGLVKKIKNH